MPSPARLSEPAWIATARPPEHPAGVAPFSGAHAVNWQWWVWPHLLSLDAPVVAIGWQWWWMATERIPLSAGHFLILGFAVWLIYLADRLADVRAAAPGVRLTDRHGFCLLHRQLMRGLLASVTLALVVVTPILLPWRQFAAGLALLGGAALYYWRIHHARRGARARMPKEAIVGGMFSLGSAFFVGCSLPSSPGGFLLSVLLFGALCSLNCALISAWERSSQDLADPLSVLNTFPRLSARLGHAALLLTAGTLLVAFLTRSVQPLPVALGAFALWALDRGRARLSARALRILADAVLLAPLLAWPWRAALP